MANNADKCRRSIVLTGREKQFPDHGFSSNNGKIMISGVYILHLPDEAVTSISPAEVPRPSTLPPPARGLLLVKDEHSRWRVPTPTSGHLYLCLRGNVWEKSSAAMHARDLRVALRAEFPDGCPADIILTVDQCEDNNPENVKTQTADYDIWSEFGLGVLIRCWYAPGAPSSPSFAFFFP